MITLIILLALGLILGIFAIQNNTPVSINYGGYSLSGIPLYGVVIGSMLLGTALSWLLSLFGWASTSMRMRGKDKAIREYSQATHDLEHRVDQLEHENEKLREEKRQVEDEYRSEHSPIDNVKERIKSTFS